MNTMFCFVFLNCDCFGVWKESGVHDKKDGHEETMQNSQTQIPKFSHEPTAAPMFAVHLQSKNSFEK